MIGIILAFICLSAIASILIGYAIGQVEDRDDE